MDTFNLIKTIHIIVVNLFLIIYLTKTFFLLMNKNESLAKFAKTVKIPEMIISTLFLATGIYLLVQMGTTKLLIIKIVLVFASIPIAIVGFKKSNKVLALLSFLMIVASYGLAEMNKKHIDKQTISVDVADINSPNYNITKHGEAVYGSYCQSCHGVGGINGNGGVNLTLSQMNRDAKMERIKNGSGSMAGFKDVLNEQEINAVVDYVETLKK